MGKTHYGYSPVEQRQRARMMLAVFQLTLLEIVEAEWLLPCYRRETGGTGG